MKQYEYMCGMEQQSKITWVNGNLAGSVVLSSDNEQAALQSCLDTFRWLAEQGRNGWKLVSVVAGNAGNGVHFFYLMRDL